MKPIDTFLNFRGHSNHTMTRCPSRTKQGRGGALRPVWFILIGSLFVSTVTVSYYFNVPVPAGLEDPWKYHAFASGKHLLSDLVSISALLCLLCSILSRLEDPCKYTVVAASDKYLISDLACDLV